MRKTIATNRVPKQRIGRIVGAALAAAAMLCFAASNAQASIRTDVTAVLPVAAADISPGLCSAGDTPFCVGPYEAQIHLYSLECAATGTFEGRILAADGSCGIDLSAFMVPSLEGFTKPNCLTTHTYTSDAATAHGSPVNKVVVGGVARRFKLSYPAGVLGFRTGTGWVDGPDAGDNPVGDYSLVLSIQVRPRESNDVEVPCITAPFSAASLTGVIRIFDVPAG
jgi:hypothetical protein